MTSPPRALTLARRPGLVVGATGLLAVLLLAVLGPWVWGDQAAQLSDSTRATPGPDHWLGTDALGRDVLARTLTATRLTLETTTLATALAAGVGLLLGGTIWLSGPRVRTVGLRVIDVLVSYPSLILALLVAAVVGPGPTASVLAVGVAGSPVFARLTANLAGSVAARDYVTSARMLGVPKHRLFLRHMLPNMAEPLLVLVSVAFGTILVTLSGLSFLGLGAQPPHYDWGSLLSEGLRELHTNPSQALGPALAIVLTGTCAGLVGDAVAAGADARSSGVRALARSATRAPVPAADAAPDHGATVLSVRSLTVRDASGTRLVDDVSLDVGRGEIVGVVGESGSGKTLTAMAVARLLQTGLRSSAEVMRLGDLDLRGHPQARRLALDLGVVFQDPLSSLNPALRMGNQLTEVLRTHAGASAREAHARVRDSLARMRVTDPDGLMRGYPHQLSGGMRQRAMIAAALACAPKLIVADEPTTALDVTVQADVLRLLREAGRDEETSVLLISHDIAVVSSVCDRVLVMYSGRVVESLDTAALRRGEAAHPYTRALISATPAAALSLATADGGAAPERLATIPGRPPQPGLRPPGCAFAPRCSRALDPCRDSVPVPVPTGTGSAACFAPVAFPHSGVQEGAR
ncbi:dipeptide/oligopeptide/nickel ABC transporter permease/ATP-binding protein [Nocardiopsis sp. YSL2]|uniref:dipeptide/oligopeptide/nickel ABC transporter permease/ATP-binding protein n=1 Tax=Nocardiopsis sp. YSL2 TaxID=2939492 RepID=UPI0026F4435E|nr:dipeptide/oligopeptide/nickel ABC transporter permease/ATP-binding protein [Nocardiopsis sp. YSL2]